MTKLDRPKQSGTRQAGQRQRYSVALNPSDRHGCTRCPLCSEATKVRKFPLVIHIHPHTPLVLNKSCRFCPACELVIVRQNEIEPLMAKTFEAQMPEIVGNKYDLIGTLDRADWRQGDRGELSPQQLFERVWLFEKYYDLKLTGGWGRAGA